MVPCFILHQQRPSEGYLGVRCIWPETDAGMLLPCIFQVLDRGWPIGVCGGEQAQVVRSPAIDDDVTATTHDSTLIRLQMLIEHAKHVRRADIHGSDREHDDVG